MRGPKFKSVAKWGPEATFNGVTGIQVDKPAKALDGNLYVRRIHIDAKARLSAFAGNKLEKRFVKSRNRLSINGISAGDEDSSEATDKVLDVDTFTTCTLPEIKQVFDLCEKQWFLQNHNATHNSAKGL
jgi:hypothetical protein